MKTKHTTNYGFSTMQESLTDHTYQVVQLFPHYREIEGGICRSRRDAAECARAAIRRLEAGTHHTQQVAA